MTNSPYPDLGDTGPGSGSQSDTPLAALRPSSRSLLSSMLNSVKVLPTESGLPRDWRGLAELAGINSEMISFLQAKPDPMAELVQAFCKSSDSRCKFFSDLKAFLAVIDRFDVVDDVEHLLVSDAQAYLTGLRNGTRTSTGPLDPSVDSNILTIEDSERIHQNLPLTRYDAFILFSDEDSEFAQQVIDKLETEYNLKLCVKDRDLLPGIMFEHEVIGRLIEERCNRFLVIFSPNFLRSDANNFLVSYAQASALESRVRKIVPCVYEPCELPPSVRHLFSIKYNRAGRIFNFWDKLGQSLRSTVPSASSTTGSNKLPASLTKEVAANAEESFKWWDAEKSIPTPEPSKITRDSPPPTYSQTMKSMESTSGRLGDDMSISSDTHLLSSIKNKKRWKFRNPMKSKKDKSKGSDPQRAAAVAE